MGAPLLVALVLAAQAVELRTGFGARDEATPPAELSPATRLESSPDEARAAWARLDVRGSGGAPRYVELDSPMLAEVLFIVDDAHGHRVVALDGSRPISERPIASAFPTLEVFGDATVHVRVQDRGPFAVDVAVHDAAAWARATETRSWVLGLTLGFSLLILLYNLLMFAVTREREFGAYCLYLVPCVLITATFGGLLAHVPGLPARAPAAVVAPMGSIIGVFAIHFVQVFLRSREQLPRLHPWMGAAKWSAAVMVVLHLVLPPAAELLASMAVTTFGVVMLLVAIGVALKRNPRGTAFFALAWGTLLLFIFVGLLAMAGALPMNTVTQNSVVIGQSLEYALLALAIADRINLLKAQRERALEERLAAAEQAAALSATFERYVPKEFLEQLDRPGILSIRRGDQSEKEMTVFFSDIRSFTTISEALTPREVFAMINDYLAAMAPSFEKHGGFIDKYIGDAIMALFAPGPAGDSADRAVLAALDNLAALRTFNEGRERKLAIGIGLHTGPLMLGMLGSERRLSATVLGDSVNVASRVEGMTKSYGAELLITEATRSRLKGTYAMRAVDCVRVKGKTEAVRVYDVFEGSARAEQKAATREVFEKALDALLAGQHVEARRGLEQVLAVFDDPAARVLLERAR